MKFYYCLRFYQINTQDLHDCWGNRVQLITPVKTSDLSPSRQTFVKKISSHWKITHYQSEQLSSSQHRMNTQSSNHTAHLIDKKAKAASHWVKHWLPMTENDRIVCWLPIRETTHCEQIKDLGPVAESIILAWQAWQLCICKMSAAHDRWKQIHIFHYTMNSTHIWPSSPIMMDNADC